MSVINLYGIVQFSNSLYCSADVLGRTVDISIEGHKGRLIMPSLPDWEEQDNNPLDKHLISPSPASNWKRGDERIYWGRPVSYPDGDADIELALMEFSANSDNVESVAQQIYKGFSKWLNLFEQYVILLAVKTRCTKVYDSEKGGRIEIYIDEDTGLRRIHRNNRPPIAIVLPSKDKLHLEQVKESLRLSSQGLLPRFEYQLLLEAYNAYKNDDYRKAIIEAATALEICLTSRIAEEFKIRNIDFGERLLETKYRMLGGRIELMRLLNINIPDKNYPKLTIETRNKVVHRVVFPEAALAIKVITEVEEILKLFSPQIYQSVTKT